MKSTACRLFAAFTFVSLYLGGIPGANAGHSPDSTKRMAIRDWVLRVLPPDYNRNGRVNVVDKTFEDWVKRTGELPPDFDAMPSIPFLPDPLVLDEGRTNIPVKTAAQWETKKKQMRQDLQHYIIGSIPPAPKNLTSRIISERRDGEVTLRTVELSFGPQDRAKLTMELMIPPGNGPFPVFLTQWNHREWAQIAVRRGYMACVYAAADSRDDSKAYAGIWWPEYDFSLLGRRVFATSRAVDYLYTLAIVDKKKIALTGHSRNGKLSLMAAALDERITAVNTSSSGTGGEVPWRFATHSHDVEDLALLTCAQPAWFHPRLRYFIGREDKLPVDQNSWMALIAPRGLMLSTALNESAGNPWGIEQAYHDARGVYRFLGKESNIAVRTRPGKHSVSAKDLEDYIDFFDYVFGRTTRKPEQKLNFPYTFENWKLLSGEKVNPKEFTVRNTNGTAISTTAEWTIKKTDIQKRLEWLLGKTPPGVTNYGPRTFAKKGAGENSFGTFIDRPAATSKMKVMPISPYNGFGDNLFGYLYYPVNTQGEPALEKLPVVVYLHEFDYSKGFGSMGWDHEIQSLFEKITALGYAVFSYDMVGFGNRVEEGTRFYERYPGWSLMGKMVLDTKGAVDALENMEFIDGKRIYLLGHALGAKVGLFTAAMEPRIKGVISVAGFSPLRTKNNPALRTYSHLHGLIPRLGFFEGNEERIPVDYDEIIASIAPRPVFIVSPRYDKDHPFEAVKQTVARSERVYEALGGRSRLSHSIQEDHNRFTGPIREEVLQWLERELQIN